MTSSPSHIPGPSCSAFWKGQLRTWHWISSAVCLAGMLLFAVTGFTLNHAASIEAKPVTVTRDARIDPALLARLNTAPDGKPLSPDLADAVRQATGADVSGRDVENRDGELFIDMPAPGVDASLTVVLEDGSATFEHTGRGTLAVLNDLHKGRNAGPVWGWFIDAMAIFCGIFALTGLGLLWVHARGRRLTWPLTTLGFVLPVILFILFVHS